MNGGEPNKELYGDAFGTEAIGAPPDPDDYGVDSDDSDEQPRGRSAAGFRTRRKATQRPVVSSRSKFLKSR